MDIKSLPKSLRDNIRTGINIKSAAHCVTQLVLNSLDAKSTAIAIRVNLITHKIQVIDNGDGISKKNLKLVGIRYMTSKFYSIKELNKRNTFGCRGEAIASVINIAKAVSITSRTKKTYRKTFHDGKYVAIENAPRRSCKGTTITVENFLYNMPVRQNYMDNNMCIEEIRNELETIAVIHPYVSFSLRNDSTGQIIFQTYKTKLVIQTCHKLFGKEFSSSLRKINHKEDVFSVTGVISVESYPQKKIQFVYVNKRHTKKTKIHSLINSLLSKSYIFRSRDAKISKKITCEYISPNVTKPLFASFIVNISCPNSEIDIVDYINTVIEFKNWEKVLICIKHAVLKFLEREKLIDPIKPKEKNITSGIPLLDEVRPFRASQIAGVIRGATKKRELENSDMQEICNNKSKSKSNSAPIDSIKTIKEVVTKELPNAKENISNNKLEKLSDVKSLENGKDLILDMFLKSTAVFKTDADLTDTYNIQNTCQSTKTFTTKSLCVVSSSDNFNMTCTSKSVRISEVHCNNTPQNRTETKVFKNFKKPFPLVKMLNRAVNGTVKKIRKKNYFESDEQWNKRSSVCENKYQTKIPSKVLQNQFHFPKGKIIKKSERIQKFVFNPRKIPTKVNFNINPFTESTFSHRRLMTYKYKNYKCTVRNSKQVTRKRNFINSADFIRPAKLGILRNADKQIEKSRIKTAKSMITTWFDIQKQRPKIKYNDIELEYNHKREHVNKNLQTVDQFLPNFDVINKVPERMDLTFESIPETSSNETFTKPLLQINKAYYPPKHREDILSPPPSVINYHLENKITDRYISGYFTSELNNCNNSFIQFKENHDEDSKGHKENILPETHHSVVNDSLNNFLNYDNNDHCYKEINYHNGSSISRNYENNILKKSSDINQVSYSYEEENKENIPPETPSWKLNYNFENLLNYKNKSGPRSTEMNDHDNHNTRKAKKCDDLTNTSFYFYKTPEENSGLKNNSLINRSTYFESVDEGFVQYKTNPKLIKLAKNKNIFDSSENIFSPNLLDCSVLTPSIPFDDYSRKKRLPESLCTYQSHIAEKIYNKNKYSKILQTNLSKSNLSRKSPLVLTPINRTVLSSISSMNLLQERKTKTPLQIRKSNKNTTRIEKNADLKLNKEHCLTSSFSISTSDKSESNSSRNFRLQNASGAPKDTCKKNIYLGKTSTKSNTTNFDQYLVSHFFSGPSIERNDNYKQIRLTPENSNSQKQSPETNRDEYIKKNHSNMDKFIFSPFPVSNKNGHHKDIDNSLSFLQENNKKSVVEKICNDQRKSGFRNTPMFIFSPFPVSNKNVHQDIEHNKKTAVEEKYNNQTKSGFNNTPSVSSTESDINKTPNKVATPARILQNNNENCLQGNLQNDKKGSDAIIENTEVINNSDDTGKGLNESGWIKHTTKAGNAFYVNFRTGIKSFHTPKKSESFTMTKRHSFMPKGMSPILFSSSLVSKELSPASKHELHETIAKMENDELCTVKWMNYFKTKDAEAFFTDLYQEKRHYETEIPYINAKNVPKSVIKCFENYLFTKELFDNIVIIDQLDKKFIVTKITIDKKNDLIVLFDQHAVHERIRLENLLKDYHEPEEDKLKFVSCQVPIKFKLNDFEIRMLTNYKKNFENWGVYYEIQDNFTVKILRIPTCWQSKNDSNKENSRIKTLLGMLIKEESDWLRNVGKINMALPLVIQNSVKSEACRGAIKFGDSLSKDECLQYINDLSICDLPFQCAHGRPTLTPVFNMKVIDNTIKKPKVDLRKLKRR